MKPCDHDSYPLYKQLIEPLRERAKELGYCLAVHGTLKRDIDLVAVPWVFDAIAAEGLAEQLRMVAQRVVGYAQPHPHERPCESNGYNDYHIRGCPGFKPHGRLAFTYHLTPTHNGPYLDISVMPRVQDADARPSLRYGDAAAYKNLLTRAEKIPVMETLKNLRSVDSATE